MNAKKTKRKIKQAHQMLARVAFDIERNKEDAAVVATPVFEERIEKRFLELSRSFAASESETDNFAQQI